MFFYFVKYKLDTIKLKTKLFAGSKRGTLFAAFLRAVSYIAIQDEIPMINSFNLFRREADTSLGGFCHRNAGKRIVSGGIYRVTEVKIIKN